MLGKLLKRVTSGKRGGAAQPQEGQAGTPPQGRGFMKNSSGMVGTAFSRLQNNPGFQEALAKNKAARGNGEPPMAGNRAMGVVNRAFREGVRKNAPAPAADRPNQTMKKGGSVSARADGIAKKGKTKGRMV